MAATPDETLAEEGLRRTKAGATAITGGLLTLLGAVLILVASGDLPLTSVLDTLRSSLGVGDTPGPGPLARLVIFFDDNIALIVAARIVPVVGSALVTVALVFLYRSAKARDPQLGKLALITTISGGVLAAVAAVAGSASLALDAGAFADSARQTEQAARDVLTSSFTTSGDQLAQLGTRVLGLGIALTAWHAMRVGLLTRFMGVLGIIVGLLYILPLDGTLPFVKIFWLLALGLLFLQRWPGPMPPAWVTGEAQPWPTQQEIREGRAAAQAERGGKGQEEKLRRPRRGRAEPPETPAPELPRATKPHSSSKKKKRKRR